MNGAIARTEEQVNGLRRDVGELNKRVGSLLNNLLKHHEFERKSSNDWVVNLVKIVVTISALIISALLGSAVL